MRKKMHGDQIAGWSKDAENDYFVSTSKYITVEPGYYYRVRADHFAGMQYPYEEYIFLHRRNYDQIANHLPFIIP